MTPPVQDKKSTPLAKKALLLKYKRQLFLVLFILLLLYTVVQLTTFVSGNETAQNLVADWGYLGVLIVSFIAGINALVPIPAGTFVPIFTEAGLYLPLIVVALVVGTTLADLLAFSIGYFGKKVAEKKYPERVTNFISWLQKQDEKKIMGTVFLYSSFSPFANELILVPLALMGIRFKTIIVPLLLGTVVYQTLFAYGIDNLFTRFVL